MTVSSSTSSFANYIVDELLVLGHALHILREGCQVTLAACGGEISAQRDEIFTRFLVFDDSNFQIFSKVFPKRVVLRLVARCQVAHHLTLK